MSIKQELISKFNNNISSNANLSNYSWFNLGGPAEYLFKPDSKEQLIEFLKHIKKYDFKITILGAGSNTLIRDNGVNGVVIKLGSSFSTISLIDQNLIEVGAATLDRTISNFAKEKNIGNLEFLSCIPGSIGGAVVMNSGCYGDEISKILSSINVIDINECKEREIRYDEIKFFYRGTNLSDQLIITSVKLKGITVSKDLIEEKTKKINRKKKLSQPNRVKTGGSTFKNFSSEKKAWKLIKEAGCEDLREGDAMISKTHCNFFINNGKARSSDIEKLIKKVKKKSGRKNRS